MRSVTWLGDLAEGAWVGRGRLGITTPQDAVNVAEAAARSVCGVQVLRPVAGTRFTRSPLMKILIVVPTYQEVENVDELLAGIERHAPEADVLFVDDHSTDGTVERVRAAMERRPGRIHLLERPSKLGLGTAYIAGFKWALERDYDAAQEMDADLSHDPTVLPRIAELLETHDVVIGSRYVEGGGTRNWSLLRQLISRGGGVYARLVLGIDIHDPTGGYNAWRRRVLEGIDLDTIRSDGYSFQIELKYRASKAGFSLVETPIVFEDRRAGQSKMSSAIVLEAMRRVLTLRLERH